MHGESPTATWCSRHCKPWEPKFPRHPQHAAIAGPGAQRHSRPDFAPLDLSSLLRTVALELLPQARAKQIDFGIQPPAPSHAMAVADAHLMHEALTNLAANAIAYTPSGGTVTLAAAGDELGWSLSVEDNGPGLTEQEQATLGQRFKRGPQAKTAGSGLGLSIARSIAQRHGGALRLQNRGKWPRSVGPGVVAKPTAHQGGTAGPHNRQRSSTRREPATEHLASSTMPSPSESAVLPRRVALHAAALALTPRWVWGKMPPHRIWLVANASHPPNRWRF